MRLFWNFCLAVTLGTGGAGGPAAQAATAMGFAAEGAAFTAVQAGIQATMAATAVGTLNHQGNVFKALEDLGKPANLRNLAVSMATAGLIEGASLEFNLPNTPKTFGEFAQKAAVHGTTNTAIKTTIGGVDLKDALASGATNFVADTLGGYGSSQIGKAYGAASFGYLEHKAFHAGLGAITGAILDPKNPGKGAAAGALGAVIGETVAEALPQTLSRETRADVGKLAAATSALLSKQDVDIAYQTSNTALQNNFLLSAGELAYEWIEEEEPEKAAELKEISLNVLSHVTGESRATVEACMIAIMAANDYAGGGLVKKIAKNYFKKQTKTVVKNALKPNLKVIGKGSNNPKNLNNKYNLQKQLASEEQMFSKGKIIIGHGTKIPLRDAHKLSLKYGGKSSDWVKKTSENFKALDGKKFETHWYENIKTDKRVEFKTKILE